MNSMFILTAMFVYSCLLQQLRFQWQFDCTEKVVKMQRRSQNYESFTHFLGRRESMDSMLTPGEMFRFSISNDVIPASACMRWAAIANFADPVLGDNRIVAEKKDVHKCHKWVTSPDHVRSV